MESVTGRIGKAVDNHATDRITALAGGVGGAKLAHGLMLARPTAPLSVIVNTGDDFSLFGLHISPDLDTVLYTLAGLAHPETGWGIAGDTFATLEMIARYGRDTWFQLGDKDFATHILRTERLAGGASLTATTAELATALGVTAQILPMCDEPVATLVDTLDGTLEFQEYFVRRRHQDSVAGVRFAGIDAATVPPGVATAINEAAVIVVCPSNPIVSIGPILAVPGMRELIGRTTAPVVVVSPIIGGQALKGPADSMLRTLGYEVSPLGVAAIYRDVIDGIVIDEEDAALAQEIEALGVAVRVAQTIMRDDDDRRELAGVTLAFAEQLRS